MESTTFSSRLNPESGHRKHQVGKRARKEETVTLLRSLTVLTSMIKEKFHLTFQESSSIFADTFIERLAGKLVCQINGTR